MASNKKLSNSFTRIELYDLVWSKPISKIIEGLPLTYGAFKEVCKDYDVPLPPNGYWQKLKFGKNVSKYPLHHSNKSYDEINLPKRMKGESNLKKLSKFELLVQEIKRDNELPLKVPEKLNKPDELIKIARDELKSSDKLHMYNYQGLYGTSKGVFSIYVSKGLIKRALLFSDSLVKLLKKRGHDVKVRTNEHLYNDNGTKVIVHGEAFEICVRETRKRVKVKSEYSSWMDTKYEPTGILTLRIEELHKYQWADAKNKKLEDKLPEILAYLELRAKEEKEEKIRRDKWHREYQEQLKKEKELKELRNKELSAFKSVINHSSRWQKSMDLRNYIMAIESNAVENNKLTEELKSWLDWIKEMADWYDPFIEKEIEIFKNVDRNTLEVQEKKW